MSEKQELNVYALSTDPIFIGTGGYTIGRVDNTIVRDTITKIPKIPGSSIAGTWRYYMALELQGWYKKNFENIKSILGGNEIATEDIRELVNRLADRELDAGRRENFSERMTKFKKYSKAISSAINTNCYENNNDNETKNDWQLYWGNLISSIKCAGQDDKANENYEDSLVGSIRELSDTGHCGHCIICKTFGFSKKNRSQQGMAYFSDLNILLFPVYTRSGVKWVTSPYILESAGIKAKFQQMNKSEDILSESSFSRLKNLLKDDTAVIVKNCENENDKYYINLGWLNLEAVNQDILLALPNLENKEETWKNISENLIIVPDDLISNIINANLEVRTSVSINPLTGTAKEGALFTSEAIPRGTVFYGNIRLLESQSEVAPTINEVVMALKDSKKYYECLGVGGMTTRGFGRAKLFFS
ncbi:hypothetical protein TSYNTROOL_12400 [Tepidanaerobacter syntrophicus]|uniref:type III-B CRISPR module RAMP protein Cmr4 n=1 Tax=Tepidanaerobacter syntrophicus TaxID=224999 RepID=UPI0022EF3C1D|nr:type III-B CRISPR module RAMP protein Cmr4 [Tepidanaerobacter syntrophicus]GLI51154.1 hypothetical protein TSYNTROOL_12400 [Tepidanaerobacter syntrophicus]